MNSSTAKRRIVFVGNSATAFVNFRKALFRVLLGKGYTIYALAPDYTPETMEQLQAIGATPVSYPLRRTDTSPYADLCSIVALYRLFRRLKPDIVFSFFIKPVMYGTVAAALAGVPVRVAMIEGAGYVFTSPNPSKKVRMLRGLVQRMYRFSLSFANRVFVLNPDDNDLFISTGMVKAEKAVVLPGIGIELDMYHYSPPPEGAVSFVFVGRLLEEKGVRILSNATRRLKKRYPQTRVTLLGAPDTNPSSISQQEIQDWVHEDLFVWPGQVQDVQSWLGTSSVFVLPSYYREGLPRSTMEALATGRPVVTTNAPGCRMTVIDGENGILIEPRNENALFEAMVFFVENPEQLLPMGIRSRQLAEEKFDAEKINNFIVGDIEELLKSRTKP